MPNKQILIARSLNSRRLTLGVVESATGGLISNLLTNVAGSSEFFKGSVVAYSNEVKLKLVGVRVETLHKYGAVSAQVAEQMATGGLELLGVDVCLADTGIAGPTGGSPEKPVGLVYVAVAGSHGVTSRYLLFDGSRLANKKAFAESALDLLGEYLDSLH